MAAAAAAAVGASELASDGVYDAFLAGFDRHGNRGYLHQVVLIKN